MKLNFQNGDQLLDISTIRFDYYICFFYSKYTRYIDLSIELSIGYLFMIYSIRSIDVIKRKCAKQIAHCSYNANMTGTSNVKTHKKKRKMSQKKTSLKTTLRKRKQEYMLLP